MLPSRSVMVSVTRKAWPALSRAAAGCCWSAVIAAAPVPDGRAAGPDAPTACTPKVPAASTAAVASPKSYA